MYRFGVHLVIIIAVGGVVSIGQPGRLFSRGIVDSDNLPSVNKIIPKNALPPISYRTSFQSTSSTSSKSTLKDAKGNPNDNYIPVLLDSFQDIERLIDRIPGSRLIGRLGELANAYLISVPHHLTPDQLSVMTAASSIQPGLHERHSPDSIDLSTASDWRPLERHNKWKPRVLRPRNTDNERTSIMASMNVNDPEFDQQWHLSNKIVPGNDIQALSVWSSHVNGNNVTISLIDDGLDYTHPDLSDNFFPQGSHDFNTQSDLPYPRLDSDNHGTRCAGEISAKLGNGVCGVGLSYGSRIAGIRLLSAPITEAEEVAALNYAYQLVDIYSNSWGPDDDGKTVDGPKRLSQLAIVNAAEKGRQGRGNILVFAADYDGFANNLWTVSVGAVDINNEIPWYSEPCVAHMVVAYSSNQAFGITTTNKGGGCTPNHGGTSAAAPLVSATIALLLSIRPELTVRDIHDILRKSAIKVTPSTSNPNTPELSPQWTLLPSNLHHSDYYGYGRLDSKRALEVARVHELLPSRLIHSLSSAELDNIAIPYMNTNTMTGIRLPILSGMNVTFPIEGVATGQGLIVERVGVRVWVSHPRRGYLCIQLISPAGIYSTLATPRSDDLDSSGLSGWMFTSVKHWGESAAGEWKIAIADLGDATSNGAFTAWGLEFHGHAGALSGETVTTTTPIPPSPIPKPPELVPQFNWLYVIIPVSGLMGIVGALFVIKLLKQRSSLRQQAPAMKQIPPIQSLGEGKDEICTTAIISPPPME